jgi:hypothetical protein
MFEELKDDGYTGGITILRERLADLRLHPKKTPVVRPLGRNPAGQGPLNISNESSWYTPGQDCKALGDRSEDNS